jgi:hypothetical protein
MQECRNKGILECRNTENAGNANNENNGDDRKCHEF